MSRSATSANTNFGRLRAKLDADVLSKAFRILEAAHLSSPSASNREHALTIQTYYHDFEAPVLAGGSAS